MHSCVMCTRPVYTTVYAHGSCTRPCICVRPVYTAEYTVVSRVHCPYVLVRAMNTAEYTAVCVALYTDRVQAYTTRTRP